jgi:hypothetical protein
MDKLPRISSSHPDTILYNILRLGRIEECGIHNEVAQCLRPKYSMSHGYMYIDVVAVK